MTRLTNDSGCVAFLQWALPRLGLRWAGYRKVRRQVCKRINRRIRTLGLANLDAYRAYLEAHDEEWRILDGLTRITISRFYRERRVFARLCDEILPELAAAAAPEPVRIWCAGCAGGEEVYTLRIGAHLRRIPVEILGTDLDERQLERARVARYSAGSLKELPDAWIEAAFEPDDGHFRLRPRFQKNVELRNQDIRQAMPDGPFHLVLCRYLPFMYFAADLQTKIALEIRERVTPGGYVVLGKHESWPADVSGLVELERGLRIYRVDPRGAARGDSATGSASSRCHSSSPFDARRKAGHSPPPCTRRLAPVT